DPGEKSSQSPPHIDHHCCFGCGDSLDGIFCQRCACKSCGKGAYYGFNFPSKVPIISIPKPCHNQNVEEFPQTLPSFHLTCYSRDENSFAYDSTPDCVNDSSNVSTHLHNPRIDEADCDPEEEIRLIEKLLYDNSSPHPSEEIDSKNFDVVIESFSPSPIPIEDSDPFMEELNLFLTSDGSIPLGIDSDYSDSERDNLFPKRLMHNDLIPLPNFLDFLNVVRIPPPLFTYPVTSSILLSSESEDIIFDPGISNYHFSSLEPDVSYLSGTFMKFNVYPNHLNESPIEILSSTCSPMDQ
nr:hypothetical protein [Tanacetum cinerariifolium]